MDAFDLDTRRETENTEKALRFNVEDVIIRTRETLRNERKVSLYLPLC